MGGTVGSEGIVAGPGASERMRKKREKGGVAEEKGGVPEDRDLSLLCGVRCAGGARRGRGSGIWNWKRTGSHKFFYG